jgi:PST family polysaccharide transporter
MSIQQAIDSLQFERWVRIGLRSTVARNAASLYLIQFANYIVPLIMIPYLVRVLGPAGYGAVAFGQGLINYFMLFVEYGFDWSATRKISVHRNDPQAVNATALCVWAAKGLLALIGFGILWALAGIVPRLSEEFLLLLILYGLVWGNVLFPTWLFQGMERMVAISLINLGMKLGVLIGVFTLIRKPEHYLLYAGLMSFGAVLSGMTGMIVAFRMFRLRFDRITWSGVWETLKEGWVLFLSRASVSLYTTGNAFILGMLTNNTVVGYYSAAEKIVLSISGLMDPIAQAVYPRFSKLSSESELKVLRLAQTLLMLMGCIGFFLTCALIIAAPMVAKTLLGAGFERSIAVMRILAAWIFINGVTNVWGIEVMLPLGYDKAFFTILLLAGLTNVVLAIPLASHWNEIGMAVSVLLSCIFVTVAQPAYLWKEAGITPWLSKNKKWRNGDDQ